MIDLLTKINGYTEISKNVFRHKENAIATSFGIAFNCFPLIQPPFNQQQQP
jgi:hypothetical protein